MKSMPPPLIFCLIMLTIIIRGCVEIEYPIFITTPDNALQNYLISNYDFDGDGKISIEEAERVTKIDCRTKEGGGIGVKSIKGIEKYTSLETLILHDNEIEHIDISLLHNLKSLDLSKTKISNTNIGKSLELISLDIGYNNIPIADLSQVPNLETLNVSGGKLKELNISNNPNIVSLYCSDTELTELDLGSNTKLSYLDCNANQFTALDISKNISLGYLKCSENKIVKLDISKNKDLYFLGCNPMSTLSILYIVQGQTIRTMEVPVHTEIKKK